MTAEPPPSKKVKVEPTNDTTTATTSSSSGATAATTAPNYSSMKIPDLKMELSSRGLSTSGKKVELIARLEAAKGKKKAQEKPKKVKEEIDETDFGKAMRALATTTTTTKSSKKKKVPKKRKVDGYAYLGPACSVVDDWDCMLNQTNIGQNNNKFYVIQLLQSYSSYVLFTRWGRVGEPGQHDKKFFHSLDDAQKEFKKKFSDKTKNRWENRHDFKPVPKKYTLLEMDDDDEGDEEVRV